MAKTKISEYSATANSNTDIGGINVDEGCAPSGINDAIRTLMAQLKNFQTGTGGDSFNGPVNGTVGATTPSTGAFTSITASGDITIDNGSADGGQLLLASSGYSNWGVDNYSGNFRWYYNTTEKMRLDNAGNLGLGVTPSAWISSAKAIQISSVGSVSANSNSIDVSLNRYVNSSGTSTYISTAAASLYEQYNGGHYWYQAGSGTAGNAITFTQAMTLDASGNLGVGTTSPGAKLEVSGGDIRASQTGTGNIGINIVRSGGTTSDWYNYIPSGSADLVWYKGSERMRIDSSGRLLVNVTSSLSGMVSIHNNASDYGLTVGDYYNTTKLVRFLNSSDAQVGSITQTGSSTAYNTSSDYRLKENVVPMTGALAKVSALKPCTYTWKIDGSSGEGFIAHELAEVIPDAVTGVKDAVNEDGSINPQGIDTSFLVATLTAAIQEQQAIIESLTARITALEA